MALRGGPGQSAAACVFIGVRGEGQRQRGERYLGMKTARFANVVAKCGPPEIYLALMEPAKDRTLQTAVKAQRVMTVLQDAVGTKTDRGEVGFTPGRARQFLVFPKSLRVFAGRTVVGIKYDLLGSKETPKSERAAPPRRQAKKSKPKRHTGRPEKPALAVSEKVIAFKPGPKDDEDEEIAAIKKQVRHAMALLEDGKAVAAFNLLKRAVGD